MGVTIAAVAAAGWLATAPESRAGIKRPNDGVVANVYTVQHQAGSTNNVRCNPAPSITGLEIINQW
jgi:hypothetical protein